MDPMILSTSFVLLRKKYRDFCAPAVRIEVDGIEITQKMGAVIANISVDLTNGASASGCAFDVIEEYDPKNTDFRSPGSFKMLQLGAKVELSLGYIVTEPVFYGFVAEVEYIFENDDEAPYIHVECVDIKCLLMKSRRMEVLEKKKITQVISEMLSSQPVSTYLKGKQVEMLTLQHEMLPVATETEYDFITRYAQYTGCEFFVLRGKAYFRKPPLLSAPLLSLSPQAGIVRFKLSLRQSALFDKAKVVGISPQNDKAVTGNAGMKGKFSLGSTASRMLNGTTQVFFDHKVESAGDASSRAKAIVESAQHEFGRVECKTVGLPELVPGRSVNVSGMLSVGDVSCYILSVRHTLDNSGFFTTFEARIDKL